MPNQIEISTSATEVTIQLKMNGERLKYQKILERVLLTIHDITFVYFAYEVYMDKSDVLTYGLLFLFLLYLLYMHYESSKIRKWVEHAEETFLISKNSLKITKTSLGKDLLTVDIDTQKIIEIFYKPWVGGAYPPYLPDCREGNIHIHAYNGGSSFGINLDQEEAEAFIVQLRSFIMQFQKPRHFIFAPHLHLEKVESV